MRQCVATKTDLKVFPLEVLSGLFSLRLLQAYYINLLTFKKLQKAYSVHFYCLAIEPLVQASLWKDSIYLMHYCFFLRFISPAGPIYFV